MKTAQRRVRIEGNLRHAWVRWLALLLLGSPCVAPAEDGHELWLRYRSLPASQQQALQRGLAGIRVEAPESPLLQSAVSELSLAWTAVTGRPLRRLPGVEPGAGPLPG